MPLSLKYRALLVKCYYKCDSNEQLALYQYRALRGLRNRPITAPGLKKIMKKFESRRVLSTVPEMGTKPDLVEAQETFELPVKEAIIEINTKNAAYVLFYIKWNYHRVLYKKIILKMLQYLLYKITYDHKLKFLNLLILPFNLLILLM